MNVCDHQAVDGACTIDGCKHCKTWSMDKLIAAFDLSTIEKGSRVTIPYGQTHAALRELKELRAILSDPKQVHVACLRGNIPLSLDDALHVGGTSRAELERLRTLERNVMFTLDQLGSKAVRVCEGGGPEDLAASLAVTVVKLEKERDEQGRAAMDLFDECKRVQGELARLTALINTPQTADYDEATKLEAAHQIERWGIEHDAGKKDVDWIFLVGFLGGKAVEAGKTVELLDGGGDPDDPDPARRHRERRLHHIIAAGAAVRNWFNQRNGGDTRMRPGIAPPKGEEA